MPYFGDDFKFIHIAKYNEAKSFRRVAFFGIFLSTISILTSIVVVPSVYGYLQRVQSILQQEADYCKFATNAIREQFVRVQQRKVNLMGGSMRTPVMQYLSNTETSSRTDRFKRDGVQDAKLYDENTSEEFGDSNSSESNDYLTVGHESATDCTCQIGYPGPQGMPGEDGRDGEPGPPGVDGLDGEDGDEAQLRIDGKYGFNCIAGLPGEPGERGPKGPVGQPGVAGLAGRPGYPGPPGTQGPLGKTGKMGKRGDQGMRGQPGIIIELQLPRGPRGSRGPAGPVGPSGIKGANGRPGRQGSPGSIGVQGFHGINGAIGSPGYPGKKGETGAVGDCSHCPLPRTAPGSHR